MKSTSSSGGGSATSVVEATVCDLSTRFPGRVQIHLHPSSTLPSGLIGDEIAGVGEGLKVALVWTVDSLKLLRGYGLTGSFTGTLAQFPQQNIFLGLPIQLLPEEVVALLRRGKAVVVDEAKSYRLSSTAEVEEIQQRVEEDRTSQQLAAWHERQTLRAKHSRTTTETPTNESAQAIQDELKILPWHYTIPTTSQHLPWYNPVVYTTLSSIQDIFAYPSTEAHIASVALFEHFTDCGMWCMNGLRFGGAFAVYPGDPLRYHSHYTAQLVLEEENIALTSLVANGRLGTAVKKTHLLCHVDSFNAGIRAELDRLQQGELKRESGSTALESIRSGIFDIAPKATAATANKAEPDEKGKRFAEFNVFSLAWAGFGT